MSKISKKQKSKTLQVPITERNVDSVKWFKEQARLRGINQDVLFDRLVDAVLKSETPLDILLR